MKGPCQANPTVKEVRKKIRIKINNNIANFLKMYKKLF